MSTKSPTPEPKEKTCFVIMPIADMDGYETGHFERVYNHLIKPACKNSGYSAERADDIANTNYIIIDILHRILESDMVICDLSGRNPNVLYELGIRQAFNLPVTLIKDLKTQNIFDIQGLRYTEYNQSLRIDEVVRDVSIIQNAISKTANSNSKDVNSLIQLLAVSPATRPSNVNLSDDTRMLLGAINDLSQRMSSLEINNRTPKTQPWTDPPKPPWSKDSTTLPIKRDKGNSFEINGWAAQVGDDIFADGDKLGVIADIEPHKLQVKTQKGVLLTITPGDALFPKLSTIPF